MVKIRDVLLVTTDGYADAPSQVQENPDHPPVDERVDLHPSLKLYVDRNDQDLGRLVLDACDPPSTKNRQWGSTWGFYRDDAPQASDGRLEWDVDRAMSSAVAISRLLHPNVIDTKYAARIEARDGQGPRITPGPTQGHSAHAFVHPRAGRVWLSKGDAEELAVLFQTYWQERQLLPEKVQRALWNHDYAVHVDDASIRFMIIATALEGLVHTDRPRSTSQFCRISRLASDVGLQFAEGDARDAYDMRSIVAHGSSFASPAVIPGKYDSLQIETLLVRLEELLRVALRRAIEDAALRLVFASDNSVRAQWPL